MEPSMGSGEEGEWARQPSGPHKMNHTAMVSICMSFPDNSGARKPYEHPISMDIPGSEEDQTAISNLSFSSKPSVCFQWPSQGQKTALDVLRSLILHS